VIYRLNCWYQNQIRKYLNPEGIIKCFIQGKLYPKKEGFVFSGYNAVAGTKPKPKYTKVTSSVNILKQYSIYRRNVWD